MGFERAAIEAVGGEWGEVQRTNEVLERLRAARLAEVRPDGAAGQSKVVWKIVTFQQVILYRIVMLADGCAAAWNARNPLASTLCARAIMETTALLYDFHGRLEAFCEAGDFVEIDTLVMNRIFSTRLADWHEQAEETKAVNILTIITKINKQLLPGTVDHYAFLSEICHPNSLGHNAMFGKLDHSTAIVALSDAAALDQFQLPRVLELSEAAKQRQ